MDTPHGSADDEIFERADLLAAGMSPRQIGDAVKAGHLIRLRRNRYAAAEDSPVALAVRIGGRLSCVSLLALLGVFVADASALHVHIDPGSSRLRSPRDRQRKLTASEREAVILHWRPLHSDGSTLGRVGIGDAVLQAVRCQSPRFAVATVDSILYLRLLTIVEIADLFHALPRRYRAILRLTDGLAESGTETLMRLILRQLGLTYRVQVSIRGLGRVDFVVDGWLIIECDSKAHHSTWDAVRRDRRRDAIAAAQGYTTLRLLAEDLLYNRDFVVAAVRGLVAAH